MADNGFPIGHPISVSAIGYPISALSSRCYPTPMPPSHFTFPKPLLPGAHIAITGPSGGVAPPLHARLDFIIRHLRDHGFKVTEGKCLRDERKHVSAEKSARARELQEFLLDDTVDAICPPWGGEVLIEILPLLDFERISRAKPKWVTSYSDISTLHFALTTRTGLATAHTPNLMDLAPPKAGSNDLLTSKAFDILATPHGEVITQDSSNLFQRTARIDFAKDVDAVFILDTPSSWKSLQGSRSATFEGRLIGGCLDTISCLTGTPSGDMENFKRLAGKDGVIFYFENCDGSPAAVVRMIQNMRQAGWLDGVNGLLIGRSSGPDASGENDLSYAEALHWALDDLTVPVVFDADVGHQPPQMTLINGAMAKVSYENGRGRVEQRLV